MCVCVYAYVRVDLLFALTAWQPTAGATMVSPPRGCAAAVQMLSLSLSLSVSRTLLFPPVAISFFHSHSLTPASHHQMALPDYLSSNK
uniref:Putative secreted protein n=1 Tax=Anopheles darlingi TaxID=43151 RepID=A0A2M4D857_ANODA